MPPPNEQTPLIQTVIVHPVPQRYSHSYVRRFCTAALTFTLIVVLVLFVVPARWLPGNHSESEYFPWRPSYHRSKWPESTGVTYEDLQRLIQETPQETKIRDWSQYYTSGQHLAGKNVSQAIWTRDLWGSLGISSHIVDYEIYLNYPVEHRLALIEKIAAVHENDDEAGESQVYQVKHECNLEEDEIEEDPASSAPDKVPTFHGYSATGNATAQYVFVNYATYEDFEDLLKAEVPLKGKIAIAKYGKVFRGLKVKRAEELGMVGVVMYSDPEEDGETVEQNGYKAYPDGPARQASSVQRGSVQFINMVSGDPTTPGYPSKPGAPRVDPGYDIPSIPSQPISYQEAIPLLKALNGHGPNASHFSERWQGGLLKDKGVEYNIGPSPPDLLLNLQSIQNYVTTPIWNVIGIINGTSSDEVVVIGNHRDAWVSGGAGDPNSGSAALNELIRSFSIALKQGWKPLRTIVFASWDGEEYGLIGSTEWVEEYMPWLSGSAVAYLNVDVAVAGPAFRASASPILNKVIFEATSAVKSPNQTMPGQTVHDTWNGYISPMGSGSDFVAFQDFTGIPSMDIGFVKSHSSAVYHYHSNYDSFTWMDRFGDAGWHYHVTATRIWGLIAASLIEQPILAFNLTDYATHLQIYLSTIRVAASNSTSSDIQTLSAFPSLDTSVANLLAAARTFDAHAAHLSYQLANGIPWWKWWQRAALFAKAKWVNKRYQFFEREFLYAKGLESRPAFKHVVFAPGLWTGYSGATFPGLIEAIDDVDLDRVKKWEKIIRERIDRATRSILG